MGRRKLGQLDLFPPPAWKPQSIADLDAEGVKCCQAALDFHAAYPNDPRATRAAYSALMIFGAIEILKQRGHK